MASYTQLGGFAIGQTLNQGYPGNVSRSSGDIITNRAVQQTDSASIPFGGAAVLNGNNTYSALGSSATTLATALTTATAYTSLSVAALTAPVAIGDTVTIGSQSTTATAAALIGATTLAVASFTTTAAYAVGTAVVAQNVFSQFAGVAIREVQQATSYFPGTGGTYQPGMPCDVIERGTVTVACNYGTPTAGGPVYCRTVLNTANVPNGVVGGFEAAPDPTTTSNSFLVTNAQWTTGTVGVNGNAEITLLVPNKA